MSKLIVRKIKSIDEIPASHEDRQNPQALKRILFSKKDFPDKKFIRMINWARLPPKNTFRKHYHQDMTEIFIMIEGKAEIKVDKKTITLSKGDAISVPQKVAHEMKNLADSDAYYLVVGLSAGKGGKTINVK